MATLRSSNLDLTKLGISIEPVEVRLITSADDPYTWQILPEKEHLFKKHLSKHSIGAYKELCREVGVSFEAVLAPESSNAAEWKLLEERRGARDTSSPKISFTAVISQLKREKLEMATELNKLHDQATKVTELKHLAEEEAARLRSIIQAAEVDKQMLQQEVQNLTGMVEYFRNTIANSVHEVLKRLKLDLSLYTSG
ncbi:hypothetical protein OEA41_008713 [Lepraria neglecta]|uniref:Uncharacterized protein n=1 Tax=Lepraria neglecta TaxID=209136 RepID=A0AAE0DHE3_9LECA|nr:hypothetical protein OEA41_008713 [Lepraria neglecta]